MKISIYTTHETYFQSWSFLFSFFSPVFMEREKAAVPWHKGTKASPSLTSHESRLAFLLAVVETRQLRHACMLLVIHTNYVV